MIRRAVALVLAMALAPLPGAAQQVAFGGIRADTSAPVEITADTLAVDQASGRATFSGNVTIGQGEMRLAAARVEVEYGASASEIRALRASGGVTLVSGAEAAEAAEASYAPASGTIVLSGDVLLTQGRNVMAGERLEVDLASGTGTMSGRVRTVLQPGSR